MMLETVMSFLCSILGVSLLRYAFIKYVIVADCFLV